MEFEKKLFYEDRRRRLKSTSTPHDCYIFYSGQRTFIRFATPKVHAIVTSILLGDIVQCVFVVLLLFNKVRSLLTAWGRVLCNSATDSASLMNCFTGLVNRWSRPSLVMEPQSTPKRVSYRELTTLQTRWSRRGDHEMSS